MCAEHFRARRTADAQATELTLETAVERIDARTRTAVDAFLEASAGIEPEAINVSTRKVRVRVPGKPGGLFRKEGPLRWEERLEHDTAPGHRVFSWASQDTSDPPVRKALSVCVMLTADVLLFGGWRFPQVSRGGHHYVGSANTRGKGVLPGFLARYPYTHEGPLIPGLPLKVEELARTAEWFEERLAEYLAAHQRN